jgi:hypothetical protein
MWEWLYRSTFLDLGTSWRFDGRWSEKHEERCPGALHDPPNMLVLDAFCGHFI